MFGSICQIYGIWSDVQETIAFILQLFNIVLDVIIILKLDMCVAFFQ